MTYENYAIATELTNKPEQVQVATLLTLLGNEGYKIYINLPLSSAEILDTPKKILDRLERQFTPTQNLIYNRYIFNSTNQGEDEPIDAFVNKLREAAKICSFGAIEEELIRDRLVLGIRDDSIRKKLLLDTKLTLDTAITSCKLNEQTVQQLGKIQRSGEVENKIYKVKTHRKDKRVEKKEFKNCRYCGGKHEKKKESCPAYGATCLKCQKKNHYAKCCKTKTQAVKEIEDQTEEESDTGESIYNLVYTMGATRYEGKKIKVDLNLAMENQGKEVTCQIDTGATCNVIGFHQLCNIAEDGDPKMNKSGAMLKFYNGNVAKPKGEVTFKCHYKNNMYDLRFQVVEGKEMPLIGAESCLQLNLLKLNVNAVTEAEKKQLLSKEEIIERYQDTFKGLGCLPGEYTLKIDTSVTPIVNQPRRVPVSLKSELKKTLDKLCQKKIIEKVTEPTAWVSNLVIVKRPNKLRICLDPRDLNKALKRSHYQIPTIEEVLPKLSKAKVFSILDASEGFWQIKLEDESSYLTTFWTPFGRFKWNRMPFGISTAPEEFQRRLHEILEDLKGVEVIADDILVYGSGDTKEEAIADHDSNLRRLMEKAKQVNMKFNLAKFKFQREKVEYMGHVITGKGLEVSPTKIEAITNMPRPKNRTETQRLLGMVNYLSRFLPQLSEVCEPLRKLIHKDNSWAWQHPQEAAYNKIKQLVAEPPVLKYFSTDRPVTIQCDASSHGLGATLLQEGQPVAFASRTLTKTEENYAQIEKECLAIVFACEKFHQYICGQKMITVESDHKPLEVIFKKSLLKAPKRLQRMLLRLQNYDLKVTYKPGKEMLIADLLSRATIKSKQGRDKSEKIYDELEEINMTEHLNLRDERLQQIQKYTYKDKTLQKLTETILQGWPENKQETPIEIREYWQYKEELSVQNGVVFKGMTVIIPKDMRREMAERVHESHLGAAACIRKARDIIFWPGMTRDLKDKIENCEACRETDIAQQKQTMITHQTPTRPWQRIAMDLFQYKKQDYIVIVDYYSDYWETEPLQSTAAEAVIQSCKKYFSIQGIPEVIDTDAGTQFDCAAFREFSKKWGFEHCTSSPYHHQSNGKAESAVKIVKKILKRTDRAETDFWKAVLNWRNTPTEGMNSSPVQRLMSRRTNTGLPTTAALLKPKVIENVTEKINERKHKYREIYDQRAKERRELVVGEDIRVQLNPERRADKWVKGRVVQQLDPRAYIIDVEGHKFRRNSRHIRTTETATSEKEEARVNDSPEKAEGEEETARQDPMEAPMEETPGQHEQVTSKGRHIKIPQKYKDYVL